MIPKLNAFQKLLHRFVMIRPVTAFFAPKVHHLDKAILTLTKGRYTGAELLGWPILRLTTTGARTGQPHTMPLIGIFHGEGILLVASSFGRKHNPDWYYNLKANPACGVLFKGRRGQYIAREAKGDEYEKYKERAAHRHIPIMVLEPKK